MLKCQATKNWSIRIVPKTLKRILLEICYLNDKAKTKTKNVKIEFLLDHSEILVKLENSFLKRKILCPIAFTP